MRNGWVMNEGGYGAIYKIKKLGFFENFAIFKGPNGKKWAKNTHSQICSGHAVLNMAHEPMPNPLPSCPAWLPLPGCPPASSFPLSLARVRHGPRAHARPAQLPARLLFSLVACPRAAQAHNHVLMAK